MSQAGKVSRPVASKGERPGMVHLAGLQFGKMRSNGMGKKLLILAAIAAAIVIAVGPFRLHKARQAAGSFAAGLGIHTEYAMDKTPGSKEEFLTKIWQLAMWETKVRVQIDEAFDRTGEEYSARVMKSRSGYEKEEELLAFAMEEKWRELRGDLEQSVKNAIDSLFGNNADVYGVKEEAVRTCYRKGSFGRIPEVMQSVENGAGMEAYNLGRYGLDEDWSALPMDIACGLRPKLIMAGCEAALLSAVKDGELYEVSIAVRSAEKFAARYHVTVEGLESAKKKEERLEYTDKPDIPSVGMSTSKARATKLGAPTRTTTETGSWMHKKHTYGDMIWERGAKQIFRVHYYDGEITDVYDTRNSTAKSPWVSSLAGGSSKKKTSFDPDEHDIEAYFEDNRDEYDDYDDAYEGFLDDEGAWDDY